MRRRVRRKMVIALTIALWSHGGGDAFAAPAELVRDIATEEREFEIDEMILYNGELYFFADSLQFGQELFRSDGTTEGTELVRDLLPGPDGGVTFDSALVEMGGLLYFVGLRELPGNNYDQVIYRSDGTWAGTFPAFASPGELESSVLQLTASDSLLFFTVTVGANGRELCVSDGTSEGTMMVEDIRPGSSSSSIGSLTSFGDRVVFVADDGVNGLEPWISDGTPEGTFLLADIGAGTASGPNNNTSFVEADGKIFFAANDGIHGNELWMTDGTSLGTTLAADIDPGAASGITTYFRAAFTAEPSTLWFVARDGFRGQELFGFGLELGIAKGITNVNPGAANGAVELLGATGDQVFFRGTNGSGGEELFRYVLEALDGELVMDINPGATGSNPESNCSVALPGIVLFAAQEPTAGREVWASNGTGAGTARLTDDAPGAASLGNLTTRYAPGAVDGFTFFRTRTSGAGAAHRLYRTDGTVAGTTLIDLGAAIPSWSSPSHFARIGDRAVFLADDGVDGRELWVSDGTTANTNLLKELAPGSDSTEVYGEPVALGGKLLLLAEAYQPSLGYTRPEVVVTDGTPEGTGVVNAFSAISGHGPTSPLVRLGDLAYFFARSGTGEQLWRTDGTVSGTAPAVSGIRWPAFISAVNGRLFIVADPASSGLELYASDGTQAGSGLVADIWPGADSSFYSEPSFTGLGNEVLFVADGGSDGQELWKVSEDPSSVSQVKDIFPGPESSWCDSLVALGSAVVFVADDGAAGRELWVTDGTETGTLLLRDIRPGGDSSNPSHLTRVGNSVYFAADDGTSGNELWKTDGTVAGTVLVEDLNPGPGSSDPGVLTEVLGELLFAADDGTNGRELWRSSGSAVSTYLYSEIEPGPQGSAISEIFAVDERIYLSASRTDVGGEPFSVILEIPKIELFSGTFVPGLGQLFSNQAQPLRFGSLDGTKTQVRKLTVRNPGTLALEVDSLIVPTGWSISESPSLPIGPGETHTFMVQWNAEGTGASIGTLQLASNAVNVPEFSLPIAGTVYQDGVDSDGDGIDDWPEALMVDLGFDPASADPDRVEVYNTAAADAGLFTEADVGVIYPGSPILSHNPVDGRFLLRLGMRRSINLMDFEDFDFVPEDTTVNQDGEIEFRFDDPSDRAFFLIAIPGTAP